MALATTLHCKRGIGAGRLWTSGPDVSPKRILLSLVAISVVLGCATIVSTPAQSGRASSGVTRISTGETNLPGAGLRMSTRCAVTRSPVSGRNAARVRGMRRSSSSGSACGGGVQDVATMPIAPGSGRRAAQGRRHGIGGGAVSGDYRGTRTAGRRRGLEPFHRSGAPLTPVGLLECSASWPASGRAYQGPPLIWRHRWE